MRCSGAPSHLRTRLAPERARRSAPLLRGAPCGCVLGCRGLRFEVELLGAPLASARVSHLNGLDALRLRAVTPAPLASLRGDVGVTREASYGRSVSLPGPIATSRWRVGAHPQGALTDAVHAEAAVAVRVRAAREWSAAVAGWIRGRGATRVFLAGPTVVAGDFLAAMVVCASGVDAAAGTRGALVAFVAWERRAGSVGLAARDWAAVVGGLRARRRRVYTRTALALRTTLHGTHASAVRCAVRVRGAVESRGAVRRGNGASRGRPARARGAAFDGPHRSTVRHAAAAWVGRVRAAGAAVLASWDFRARSTFPAGSASAAARSSAATSSASRAPAESARAARRLPAGSGPARRQRVRRRTSGFTGRSQEREDQQCSMSSIRDSSRWMAGHGELRSKFNAGDGKHDLRRFGAGRCAPLCQKACERTRSTILASPRAREPSRSLAWAPGRVFVGACANGAS
jgi:hypothetical protein